MSKTYCPYPFNGVSLQPNNMVLPCGQYMDSAPFQKIIPINEVRNSEYMKDMRNRMSNDQHGIGCQCPAEEEAGIVSMRQKSIEKFGIDYSDSLKIVEIFFDNVCNLKCRSCGSNNSHLWFEEEKELYGVTLSPTKYQKNTLYKDLDLSKLEMVDLYGGEPMMSIDVENFLTKLCENNVIKNIELSMSTNCTVIPKDNVLKALLTARSLKLALSIDAYGELNNVIRSGSDFNEIINVMKFFRNLVWQRPKGTTTILVHSAVSVYNVNLLPELDDFVSSNFPEFSSSTQVVQFPLFLSIKNTPEEFKNNVKQLLTHDRYSNIIKYMEQDGDDLFGHFINFHNKVNEIRQETLSDKNQLLSDTISNYKQIPAVEESKIFFKKIINDMKTNMLV